MMRDADVIVVGAAVAGSALANALGQMGVSTLVLEKGAERDNSTRGDVLHPPSLRFLERWGVLAAMHADGALPITHLAVSHRELGRLATYDVPAQDEGAAGRTLAMPHDRIEAVMQACARQWASVRFERGNVEGLIVEDGRVAGVRARVQGEERRFRARIVVGCDGSASLVRRELGIPVEREAYGHELVYIRADGVTDPPAALHFHIDEQGVAMVASRPRERMRIAIAFERGARGDFLKWPDERLRAYVVDRVPPLASAWFTREHTHVYPLARQVAHRFAASGAALVGDAAHTTHPAGATGMSLAISGAAALVERLGPLLLTGAESEALDAALAAYDAARRPAAAAAVAENHRQAMRIWQGPLHRDPEAYARAIDPRAGWGVGNAGWGQDPAALGVSSRDAA